MIELLPLVMFAVVCLALMLGYPVAFTLAGVALMFAGGGIIGGIFDPSLLLTFPGRLFGIMSNYTLVAVPLFVFMGVMLEKSRLAEELLGNMAKVCGRLPGGLGLSVILVGALLAASTGIVGATVVTMGLMSLPTMLRHGYQPALATGTICATGTLGQIIPPSIALVLLGDVLSSAYQQAQLKLGVLNLQTVSVGDLFVGAVVPGMLLVALYMGYLLLVAKVKPAAAPKVVEVGESQGVSKLRLVLSLVPVLVLITLVLGSIISGIATPTEAAGVGAMGALILAALKRQLNLSRLREVMRATTRVSAMIFTILLGASLFSLVFRGFGGEELVHHLFEQLPGGVFGAMVVVMLVIFLLGFILDFIEITFVVVPIVGPVLLAMGVDPVWLGVMIAINLQTSFLTPPFGFALFYLRGVAPESVPTSAIYRGVAPYIGLQLLLLLVLALWPQLVTWA
ncbi:TRAP transporter large permease subunit [Gilvimarinus sp. SDUM040013]|uniref:TRAP transporter large permease protein n=1 Tax=Gilvimarinus gilvus TaxID=3058038 RepID=A0ABU4S2W7_9GAMM|nr:TRAP transporter large permease subunit [Gilvimarinus sp. SDUM040013]MDO3388699.1 TRAP transporter large permease subunit [Gilvimarinus sp. SDUM040013]MDX6849594.1 TRAP transporter large permease subunit [Gilvimarinus sp. SDUM040013]